MKKLVIGAMAVGLLAPAAQASAEWGPYSVCAPGAEWSAYHACASATVSFQADVNGGGNIILQVRNLGLYNAGVLATDWGYAITGIGITAPEIPNATGLQVGGTAQVTGSNPGGDWSFSQSFAGFSVEAGASTTGANGGIWGCNGAGAGNRYFRTCDDSEYVQFTFHTSMANWNAADATVSFAMRGQSGYDGDSYRCSDDPAVTNGNGGCDWGDGSTDSTVPEPISLVLLGSGLLGLAGVRNRRRHDDR